MLIVAHAPATPKDSVGRCACFAVQCLDLDGVPNGICASNIAAEQLDLVTEQRRDVMRHVHAFVVSPERALETFEIHCLFWSE